VPGIDAAFLAMDTEEGKEVVWNEVQFSEKKNFKEKEVKKAHLFLLWKIDALNLLRNFRSKSIRFLTI
jgi:hypothetical protein